VIGRFKAKAIEGALGFTKGGKEQVAVALEIIEGDHAGTSLTWYGFFTEKTTERTFESLRHLGWKGDDLSDLDGILDNEVSIQVEEEDDDQGRTHSKVRWINAPGGGLAMKERMDDGAAKAFAQRMKGQAMALRRAASGGAKPASSGGSQPRPSNGSGGGYGGNGRRPPPDEPNPFGADDFPKDGIPF
jgi:hypothetical protein